MPKFVVVLDNVQTPIAGQRFTRVVEAEDAKSAPQVAFDAIDKERPLESEDYTTTLVEEID
ncbi:MAG: hypothetical protein AAB594_02345 [Patescibacteria group bacterium]